MKGFIEFCAKRRVTVSMLTATVILFGVMAWLRLDREFMPDLQFPELNVLSSYPNASSQEVENLVTKVVEEAAGTVKNVHRIHSSSREGISIVTVEFLWGTNMDMASLNLREKVDLAKAKLPRDAGEPRIEKFNPFALPVLTLTLSGSLSDHELLLLARRPVAEMLEKSRGVAAVAITGGREREILVELDQSKLAARGLPILDVGEAISRANITYPAGTVKDDKFEYVVRVLGTFETVPQLENVAVSVDRSKFSSSLSPQEVKRRKAHGTPEREHPQPITLGSLGRVKDTLAEVSSYSRYDGRATVSISILKQAEANIVRVADSVQEKLPEIRSKLPTGVTLDVVYDQSTFVKSGIHGMVQDGLVGGLLAFLVLLIFLGNRRDATVVSLAIPISVFGTLFCMFGKGMSLNTITLAAIAIGIGNLVDGAIVVQENIARHRAMGKRPVEASIDGSAEVFGAVTSSNLTTVAVFLPLIFVTGVIGQIFSDLAWTIIFSQLVSQVVAFTVIPMMAAALPPKDLISTRHSREGGNPGWIPAFAGMTKYGIQGIQIYNQTLAFALNKPSRVLSWAGGAFLISVIVLFFIPKSLFPDMESDQIILRLDMPMGSSLETTNKTALRIESAIKEVRDVEHRSVTVGSIPQEGLQPLGTNQAQIVVDLDRRWGRSSRRVKEELRDELSQINLGGGRVNVSEQGGTFSFLAGQGAPVVVEVKGYELKKLESASNQLSGKLKEVKGLVNVRAGIAEPAPELQLDVKRDALANISLSVSDLAETILAGIKGKVVSKFREGGKEIDVRMRLQESDRKNITAVESLLVHSPLDTEVPVSAVALVREGKGPSEIIRYDQQRTILVSADLAGRSLDRVSDDINALLSQFKEKDISLTLTGESARMAESFQSLQVVLVLSILFVFMIMAAQFESLWQPFLILFTIPMAVIGLTPGLLLTGNKVTAMAGMGMVLLAGIVVNNGIVLIDFVNQSRADGSSLKEALLNGCHTRLRPIVMTALTTIIGMVPLALGIGEGADMQAPMAIVIVSGLFVSTLLTLVILPALFLYVDETVLSASNKAWILEKSRSLSSIFKRKDQEA